MKHFFVACIVALCLVSSAVCEGEEIVPVIGSEIRALLSQEVSINGNKFIVNGNEIWFNGISTPWHLFDDLGRTDFDPEWWKDEFASYKENNINLARVWIHGSGEISPDIGESGYVSGASDLYWEHMDHLIAVSKSNGVYILPALLSFDITKDSYSTYQRWRNFLQSESNIQSYGSPPARERGREAVIGSDQRGRAIPAGIALFAVGWAGGGKTDSAANAAAWMPLLQWSISNSSGNSRQTFSEQGRNLSLLVDPKTGRIS